MPQVFAPPLVLSLKLAALAVLLVAGAAWITLYMVLPLVRLAAVVALVWLALLVGVSWTDYATRGASPAPWSARP